MAAASADYASSLLGGNNNNNNNKLEQHNTTSSSCCLAESTSELILPPPSSWFDDDLAAAAPSDDEESTCGQQQQQQQQNELVDSCDDDSIAEEPPMNITISTNHHLQQQQRKPSSTSSLGPNFPSRSPIHHHKTPPLDSFRMDPSLTPPRVVAAPSPSWKEISSQVLPSAAKELLTSSLRRICHTARLSYAKGRWTRKYSDLGNNSGGYFRNNNNNSTGNLLTEAQQFADLPPFSSLSWVDRQMVKEWRTYLPEEEEEQGEETKQNNAVLVEEDADFDRARTLAPAPMPRPVWQKADICFECRKKFGPTRLRHHCRLCGYRYVYVALLCLALFFFFLEYKQFFLNFLYTTNLS